MQFITLDQKIKVRRKETLAENMIERRK